MSNARRQIPARLEWGSRLTFVTGLLPFLVALVMYVLFFVSLENPSQPWRASGFQKVEFSLDDIRACNEQIADLFVLSQHIEFANVINTGFLILMISACALRRGERWAWWALLIIFLWVGLNDAIALLRDNQRPIPLIGEVIGLVGLWIAKPEVFRKDEG